jgi:hypothetical protein
LIQALAINIGVVTLIVFTIRAIRRNPLEPKEAIKSVRTWFRSKLLVVKTAVSVMSRGNRAKDDE